MRSCPYTEDIKCRAIEQPPAETCFVCLANHQTHNLNALSTYLGDVQVSIRNATFLYNSSKEIGKGQTAMKVWFQKHKPKVKPKFQKLDLAEKVGIV